MNKRILIVGIAILLITVGLSGCSGNTSNDKNKFIGAWESATQLNQKTTTFRSNGTGFDDDGPFEWKIKDGQLSIYWINRDNTIIFDYQFLDTEKGVRLILTNTITEQVDDYRKII
ncbi:hypothetical protein AYK24_06220 [Thermoplasmatales archaeon SG8-52-4]|nr:MAG: hypothetical protein AYK24_06220 [Thermoplasmatales archaeon SG8-52-4]